MDRTIPIDVDRRRSGDGVLAALQNCSAFHVTVTHLPLGHYLVDGTFLFERKTMADLAVSIIEGRLFDQALQLSKAPMRPAIILEGTSQELAESGMTWEAMQGALVTVTLFCGISLLRTRSVEETIRTMLFAARQGRALALRPLSRAAYRAHGKRARQLYILQGLPGVGPRRASQLLTRFGSIERIIAASPDELCSVRGVGRQIAEKIRWALEEPPCRYLMPPALRAC